MPAGNGSHRGLFYLGYPIVIAVAHLELYKPYRIRQVRHVGFVLIDRTAVIIGILHLLHRMVDISGAFSGRRVLYIQFEHVFSRLCECGFRSQRYIINGHRSLERSMDSHVVGNIDLRCSIGFACAVGIFHFSVSYHPSVEDIAAFRRCCDGVRIVKRGNMACVAGHRTFGIALSRYYQVLPIIHKERIDGCGSRDCITISRTCYSRTGSRCAPSVEHIPRSSGTLRECHCGRTHACCRGIGIRSIGKGFVFGLSGFIGVHLVVVRRESSIPHIRSRISLTAIIGDIDFYFLTLVKNVCITI